jgi:hypothetical protein
VIVWRVTSQAKFGHSGELARLCKSIKSTLPNPSAMRIYGAHSAGAPLYNVVMDIESENLAALEQWLGERFAKTENAEIIQKMESLQEPGEGATIWNLVE